MELAAQQKPASTLDANFTALQFTGRPSTAGWGVILVHISFYFVTSLTSLHESTHFDSVDFFVGYFMFRFLVSAVAAVCSLWSPAEAE